MLERVPWPPLRAPLASFRAPAEWQGHWRYEVRCEGQPARVFFTGRGANRWHDAEVAAGRRCESRRRPEPADSEDDLVAAILGL